MNIIKKIRKENKLSQSEFANILNVHQTAVSQWENGRTKPDVSVAKIISQKFNISLDVILENERTKSNTNAFKIPVLGYVAGGIPIEAIEDILDYEELDATQYDMNYEYFGLKIKGDSMSPRIQSGDVVIVRKQPDIESGDVAIVCVNGDNATCKQVQKHSDGISLISYNAAYDIKFYSNKEIEELPVTILGKVVELRGKF